MMKVFDGTILNRRSLSEVDSSPKPAVTLLSTELVRVEASSAIPSVRSVAEKPMTTDPSPPTFLIDPALRSMSCSMTDKLALSQTIAARNLLYNPGHTLKNELGEAAYTLRYLICELSPESRKTLCTRLLGPEGLLSGKRAAVIVETLARVGDELRFPHMPNSVTGLDRSVVIALMGDIGALYVDSLKRAVEECPQQQSSALIEDLRRLIEKRGLSAPTDSVIQEIQQTAGSSSVGPLKKEERYRPPAELSPRTGIHNTGERADEQLGIGSSQRIPSAKWEVAHISNNRVLNTTEPLVAHMSGSPAEILQVWDMLRGDSREMQFLGTLNKADSTHWDPLRNIYLERQDQQLARAAGAAAFLVGLGYHSAVEVAEGTFLYMGQNLRQALDNQAQDAGHLIGHGAATSLMGELFKEQSSVHEF